MCSGQSFFQLEVFQCPSSEFLHAELIVSEVKALEQQAMEYFYGGWNGVLSNGILAMVADLPNLQFASGASRVAGQSRRTKR